MSEELSEQQLAAGQFDKDQARPVMAVRLAFEGALVLAFVVFLVVALTTLSGTDQATPLLAASVGLLFSALALLRTIRRGVRGRGLLRADIGYGVIDDRNVALASVEVMGLALVLVVAGLVFPFVYAVPLLATGYAVVSARGFDRVRWGLLVGGLVAIVVLGLFDRLLSLPWPRPLWGAVLGVAGLG